MAEFMASNSDRIVNVKGYNNNMINTTAPYKPNWTYKLNGDMETYINNDMYVLSTTQKQNRIGESWNIYNLIVYTNDFKQLASVGYESYDSVLYEIKKIANRLKRSKRNV